MNAAEGQRSEHFATSSRDSLVASPDVLRARKWVRTFTKGHRENFAVLSRLVPSELRDDYAAVYAFCRTADDAADGTGNDDAARARSLELLAGIRAKLVGCERGEFGGDDESLLFVALSDTIHRRQVSAKPFHDLLDAFEQDQRVMEYQTWDQLLGYCSKSANPVGRIVLSLHGLAKDESAASQEMRRYSDCICTALQLTNFWQDVRRDLLERNRVYVPSECGFSTEVLRDWMNRPRDTGVRRRMQDELKELSRRTWEFYYQGRALEAMVEPRLAWIVWLFRQGGQRTQQLVDEGQYTTLWERPSLGKRARMGMLLKAYWGAMRSVRPPKDGE